MSSRSGSSYARTVAPRLGGRLDEPLCLENEQRLPDGRAADPELLRELLLFQALSRHDPPLDDGLPDQVCGAGSRFAQAGGARRRCPRPRPYGVRPLRIEKTKCRRNRLKRSNSGRAWLLGESLAYTSPDAGRRCNATSDRQNSPGSTLKGLSFRQCLVPRVGTVEVPEQPAHLECGSHGGWGADLEHEPGCLRGVPPGSF